MIHNDDAPMKIQNFEDLATTDARHALLSIAEAGYEAIDTALVMARQLRREGDALFVGGERIDLAAVGKLIVIAIGKCAADAAVAADRVVGDRITAGVVVDVKVCAALPHFTTFCGTHPLPSDENMHAAEAIVALLRGLAENDLVIFVVSGGGSTLLFLPEDRANREEVPVMNALIDAGATIQEINVVRKHLSYARGGNLAKDAYPARVIALIFSDVVGDDLSSIASGPTVKDATSVADAMRVLKKYDVLKQCGLEKCGLIETPKDDKYFEHVSNVLVVSSRHALEAMRIAAGALGYAAEIRGSDLVGEADDAGRILAAAIHAAPAHTALLWAGEPTVTVRHPDGRGGRNLALAASALRFINDDEAILSFDPVSPVIT